MIVKIESPQPSCRTSLLYNERKVAAGVADIVGYAGLEEPTRECILDTFDQLEKGRRYPVRQASFHASVNPSDRDACTEEQVLDFIAGLMDQLGYGDQPYVVYRHYDIEREHYHVVSSRIDREGRKINNLFEIKRANAYMREVAQQYGFSLAEKGRHVGMAASIRKGNPQAGPRLRFDRTKPVFSQMEEIWEEAMLYDFDSTSQLGFILEDLGLNLEESHSGNDRIFTLQGLDDKGKAVTRPFTERELGLSLYDEARDAMDGAPDRHRMRFRERERVKGIVRSAFGYSRSESHFRNILRLKGIGMHLSVSDDGVPFGITFVDHTTRTVFKGSEFRNVISISMMQDAVASGRWRAEDRGQGRGAYVRAARKAAREDAVALRDRDAGIVARILRPIGQPKGASWSGRTPRSEDERRSKNEEERSGSMNADFEERRFEEKIR